MVRESATKKAALTASVLAAIAVFGPGKVSGEDPAARVLYEQAMTEKAGAQGAMKLIAGRSLLRRIVEQHPAGAVVDDAALELTRSRLCVTDAGYPECVKWRIKSYEGWLRKYPYSDRRWEVTIEVAKGYMELAERFEQDQPWRSDTKAELCRGRALELAENVVASGAGGKASAGARRIIKEIKGQGRPYSILPGPAGTLLEDGAD